MQFNVVYIIISFLIGDTPKKKQFDYPEFVNTTLRREIIQQFFEDCQSVASSTTSSISSSELCVNDLESNLPFKENNQIPILKVVHS